MCKYIIRSHISGMYIVEIKEVYPLLSPLIWGEKCNSKIFTLEDIEGIVHELYGFKYEIEEVYV
jgi:hypothetical protein